MNAGQRDFLEAGRRDPRHLTPHVVDWDAPRQSSGRWDDAVRARLGAAGLDAQREGGPSGDAGLYRGATRAVSLRPWLKRDTAENLDEPGLVVVDDGVRDVRKLPDLVRSASGVTPGDDDLRVRIAARNPADGLPRALIGGRRHGASVHDHHVGRLRRHRLRPGGEQLLFEAERVGLIHTAAEGDHRIFHNGYSPRRTQRTRGTECPFEQTRGFVSIVSIVVTRRYERSLCARCRADTACHRTKSGGRRSRRTPRPRRNRGLVLPR